MKYDPHTLAQIKRGRGNFIAMVATYGLGVFNDSFFRQSAILMALAIGREHLQGWIMSVFALPYLIFASPAGWLADRFAKRKVVIAAKALEVVAMVLGAFGVCTLQWGFILAMVFMMGLQSCMFSPALNGSIPELYPPVYVTKANASLRVAVTAMILAGISMSGLAMDRDGVGWWGVPMGRAVVAIGVAAIAMAGLMLSFGVPNRAAANPRAPFPWDGPLNTVRQFVRLRSDRLLAKIVAADIFIWFSGSMLIQFINVMAAKQFDWSKTVAGYLVAAELTGLAVGGVLVSRIVDGARWYRILPFAVAGMGIPLAAMMAVPSLPEAYRMGASFALLAVTGLMGGMVLIPSEAFVQTRPPAERRGSVLASVNFGVFAGILVSGPLANAMGRLLVPTGSLAVLGVAAIVMGAWLHVALAKEGSR